jgi:hypothetical protein
MASFTHASIRHAREQLFATTVGFYRPWQTGAEGWRNAALMAHWQLTLRSELMRHVGISTRNHIRAASAAVLASTALVFAVYAHADDAAPKTPSKHQLMKECMAKQKAADNPMPHADLRKACQDVTKNEKQNDDRAASELQK